MKVAQIKKMILAKHIDRLQGFKERGFAGCPVWGCDECEMLFPKAFKNVDTSCQIKRYYKISTIKKKINDLLKELKK